MRITDALYAPARPRSALITTRPTLRTVSGFRSMGWSSPAPAAARLRMTSVICSLYGRAAATRCCALTMRDAAISSMARVIFLVDWTLRMRLRRIRSWPLAIG